MSGTTVYKNAARLSVHPPPCATPTDFSTTMLSDYQFADTSTVASTVAWRQTLGLPVVPVAQITLVSDTTLCRRGVTAFNTILAADSLPPSVAVNLIRYGSTRYI